MEKRTILIANDDGIGAEGIARLAAAALPFGRVFVAAPDTQCSGMSQKLTIRGELSVTEAPFPVPVEAAWAIGGTPADCVKAAIKALLPVRLDVVLTGINRGYNAGFDIAYSGTVGAALEAVMNGVPARTAIPARRRRICPSCSKRCLHARRSRGACGTSISRTAPRRSAKAYCTAERRQRAASMTMTMFAPATHFPSASRIPARTDAKKAATSMQSCTDMFPLEQSEVRFFKLTGGINYV